MYTGLYVRDRTKRVGAKKRRIEQRKEEPWGPVKRNLSRHIRRRMTTSHVVE
jgi:hypothetical protein